MWAVFLREWNGVSLFIEPNETNSVSTDLFTDAFGSIDFWGYFRKQWFYGTWSEGLLEIVDCIMSICFQELYPNVVAAMVLGKWMGQKENCFSLWQHGCCVCSQQRLRKICWCDEIAATINSRHIISRMPHIGLRAVAMQKGDALSRFQFNKFRSLAPNAQATLCQISSEIMFSWTTHEHILQNVHWGQRHVPAMLAG